MQEEVFLNENGVMVTSARFVVSNQTFAMSGITSVKATEQKPSGIGPAVLIGLGFGLLFLQGPSVIGLGFALFFVIFGGVWWSLQKSIFHVALQTASGEAKALTSNDEKWVAKIVESLNDAIVHRG